MAQIHHLELHHAITIRPVTPRTIRRPGGRRFTQLPPERQAQVPREVQAEALATVELSFPGKHVHETLIATDDPNKVSPHWTSPKYRADIRLSAGPEQALVAHFNELQELSRAKGSKLIYQEGRFYLPLNWTDYFGAPVGEAELRATGRTRAIYARELTPEEAQIAQAAIDTHIS